VWKSGKGKKHYLGTFGQAPTSFLRNVFFMLAHQVDREKEPQSMLTRKNISQHRFSFFVLPLVVALVFVLCSCGTNSVSTTGSAPATPTTPAVTPTPTQSQAQLDGCPSNVVVTTPLPSASVVLTDASSGKTMTVKKGDTIEIHLAFGHSWQGPMKLEPNILTAQGPTGYAFPTAKACVWQYRADSTGTAHLTFEGRPICKPNQACPMYIMAVSFTIEIQ
jgi:hypothetical protein